jgi:hypothetical protein
MKTIMLTLGCTALAVTTLLGLNTNLHAQPAASREYKVSSINFSMGAGASAMDKAKASQEEALNKFAKEGWRLVTTAPMANGTLYLYLER